MPHAPKRHTNNKLARLQVRFSLNNTLISDKSKLDTSRLIAHTHTRFVLLKSGRSVVGPQAL